MVTWANRTSHHRHVSRSSLSIGRSGDRQPQPDETRAEPEGHGNNDSTDKCKGWVETVEQKHHRCGTRSRCRIEVTGAIKDTGYLARQHVPNDSTTHTAQHTGDDHSPKPEAQFDGPLGTERGEHSHPECVERVQELSTRQHSMEEQNSHRRASNCPQQRLIGQRQWRYDTCDQIPNRSTTDCCNRTQHKNTNEVEAFLDSHKGSRDGEGDSSDPNEHGDEIHAGDDNPANGSLLTEGWVLAGPQKGRKARMVGSGLSSVCEWSGAEEEKEEPLRGKADWPTPHRKI